MNFHILGVSYRTTPVEWREKLAFREQELPQSIRQLAEQIQGEAVILSTCNRVELYLAIPEADDTPTEKATRFLADSHQLEPQKLLPFLYRHEGKEAIAHLFRVTSSLDSLVIGEGQIAAQVRQAFDLAKQSGGTGPFFHSLFPTAVRVAKRARTETGISHGHVSVSSVGVDYVRQVFDRFDDKTVLVIGAGKMGRLTLKHLEEQKPRKILVTNRSPEKAIELAGQCGGEAVAWADLDRALTQADIILSTTGASEPVVTRTRWDKLRKHNRTTVILDIAVPRDFDPHIHDGERVFLFNIDDLTRVREQTLAQRQKHIAPAEAILESEAQKFLEDWSRRKNGPVIASLTREFENKRAVILDQLFGKLNGKLSQADRDYIEGAFRLYQNQLLHGPIDALRESTRDGTNPGLIDAIRKLFRI